MFKPGASALRAATQICICESCKGEYDSCDEFMEYPTPNVTQLNKAFLRSNTENPTTVAQDVDKIAADFLVPGSLVAIAADTNSIDTVWFIQIVESNCVEDSMLCDDYGHKIAAGVNFLKDHFLEKEKEESTIQVFRCSSKTTFFYSESILYPYVNLLESKIDFFLKNTDFIDIFIM